MRVLEHYLGDFGVLYFQKELLSSPPLPLPDFSAREGAIVIASKETQKKWGRIQLCADWGTIRQGI